MGLTFANSAMPQPFTWQLFDHNGKLRLDCTPVKGGAFILEQNKKGYVYILTNPCFKESWIKIGFTDTMTRRIAELSGATGVPLPFEIYATLATVKYKEAEKMIHQMIAKLAPEKRINPDREFFNIEPEDAYAIFENVAALLNDAELKYADNIISAKTVNKSSIGGRGKPKTFDSMGIKVGTKIEFALEPNFDVEVVDNRFVKFDGKEWLTYPLMVELCHRIGTEPKFASGFDAFKLPGEKERLSHRWWRLNKKG